jgi:outer membrane biogenesis lipoprotein LolB
VSTRTRSAVIALALASLVLAGCASSAAGPAPASPSTDSEREASLRGTEVCVQNNSAMNMRILWRGFPVNHVQHRLRDDQGGCVCVS